MRAIIWKNAWMGGLVYAGGDTLATLITDDFLYYRAIGVFILGATLYAWEIPSYFHFLNHRYRDRNFTNACKRMLYSSLFFNPLWIARHLIFIALFSGQWHTVDINILSISTYSFLYALPLCLIVNYMIQNKINLEWRYVASSCFSAFMAVYFALSDLLFGI